MVLVSTGSGNAATSSPGSCQVVTLSQYKLFHSHTFQQKTYGVKEVDASAATQKEPTHHGTATNATSGSVTVVILPLTDFYNGTNASFSIVYPSATSPCMYILFCNTPVVLFSLFHYIVSDHISHMSIPLQGAATVYSSFILLLKSLIICPTMAKPVVVEQGRYCYIMT